MSRRIGVLIVATVFLCVASAFAEKNKFKHADKNKDGAVDQKEWKMEKNCEKKQKSEVNTKWEDRADANNDGKVDAGELSAWKQLSKERIDLNEDGVIDAKEKRLCWRHDRSKVNTATEQKYDVNGNGWLEEEEVKEMLKAKQALINTKGKAKVDSAVEAGYDTNGDGVIDAGESKQLTEDLK